MTVELNDSEVEVLKFIYYVLIYYIIFRLAICLK
jgi:hypothetical protein